MKMERTVFLIDMESFYVSIEKSFYPESRGKPTVVSGDPKRRSGVILAACPIAKKYGIQTAERLWEAQQKCSDLVIIKPKMETYMKVSVHITDILYRFTDLVEPYSIDEQFVDVTGCLHAYESVDALAEMIQETILAETGVFARIGIGDNKLLAKMACDRFAKKRKDGRFTLRKVGVPVHMWPLPIRSLFGVSTRMERHFHNMAIRTIGHLAQSPLERMKKKWGIPGHVLWLSANGHDDSPLAESSADGEAKGIGHAMTLPRDYDSLAEIKVILLELCEEVASRARQSKQLGETIKVFAKGANYEQPFSFLRQRPLPQPSHYSLDLYEVAVPLFQQFWSGQPIRQIGVTLTKLSSDRARQLSLFEVDTGRKEQIGRTMDAINNKFGKASIIRAVSMKAAGQAKERAKKIGGHYK
ncbi:DNA polymerase IV [Halalkalibacter sp. APA_J-10(15)]|uniref:DNA polymerase IV n=1 Tax=Halalkalibacter sp. APA_J-10(15) TaxID=2933805 RepID=UPI001FF4AA83|nr:DNA polymerase IV [Halalkalibacter sp. APA_J-10(15)]MCK0472522.1 DNA polymerase IV [Halalkalibacter sp. APA_J-10(15)]